MYGFYPNGYSRFPITTEPGDVKLFQHSAMQFLRPAQELQHLLQTIASQPGFARQVKEAASLNQTDTVKRLIRSMGITTLGDVKFTPDGLLVVFQSNDKQACFAIRLSLCW